jgi:hypothetical protein
MEDDSAIYRANYHVTESLSGRLNEKVGYDENRGN